MGKVIKIEKWIQNKSDVSIERFDDVEIYISNSKFQKIKNKKRSLVPKRTLRK